MDKNQLYMQNLKVDEVPWHRMTTAYGRATDFPRYFATLWKMDDLESTKDALYEITLNTEHQGTLWHSTPFAMIFLVRIFKRAVSEMEKKEIAYFITEQLLDLFGVVAECSHDGDSMKHADQLPLFSDMLKEEYLWSEEYDEEDDEIRYGEDEVFPDDLFYSFYHYSYQAILSCEPILGQLENTPLKAKAQELQGFLKK